MDNRFIEVSVYMNNKEFEMLSQLSSVSGFSRGKLLKGLYSLDLDDCLLLLCYKELIKANKKFPKFQSRHEAYAVIKEEIEEATEETDTLKNNLKMFWYLTRNDSLDYSELTHVLDCINDSSMNGIKELLQVGAMVLKAKTLEDEQEIHNFIHEQDELKEDVEDIRDNDIFKELD